MYVPRLYSLDEEASWAVVREAGAGFLVAASANGLITVFAPVVVDDDRRTLRAHVARANPWWSTVRDGDEITALFNLADSYVSPNLYPSKHENPSVAPTWDYVVAEVRGRVTIRDDAPWTLDVVRRLTNQFETTQEQPWSVDDAPAQYVSKLLERIVGVEVTIDAISASAKLSQNQPVQNHDAVRDTFARGTERERQVASRMTPRP